MRLFSSARSASLLRSTSVEKAERVSVGAGKRHAFLQWIGCWRWTQTSATPGAGDELPRSILLV